MKVRRNLKAENLKIMPVKLNKIVLHEFHLKDGENLPM